MDILFLAHRAPYPPDKGDRQRAFRLLSRLGKLGPVDLVAMVDRRQDVDRARAGLRELCREVHVFPRRVPLALLRAGAALLSGGSLTEAWLTDGRVEARLRHLEQAHAYGLCWAFSSGTGPWWRRRGARHRMMDLCDLDALKWEELGRRTPGLRGAVYRLEARRLLPREMRLAEEADVVLVSSRREAVDLRARACPRRLEVLTCGADLKAFENLAPPSKADPVLGFLGQMDYPPNVRAAVMLARDVLPLVRERIPEARLRILGRSPSSEVAALAALEHVEVLGEVASVPQALESVRVFVVPLDAGRGVPTKVLEALAAGRATVLSPLAAQALMGAKDQDYLVADGAVACARTVAGLLLDPARCDQLGARGRAYARREHDWESLLDGFEELLHEVTGA